MCEEESSNNWANPCGADRFITKPNRPVVSLYDLRSCDVYLSNAEPKDVFTGDPVEFTEKQTQQPPQWPWFDNNQDSKLRRVSLYETEVSKTTDIWFMNDLLHITQRSHDRVHVSCQLFKWFFKVVSFLLSGFTAEWLSLSSSVAGAQLTTPVKFGPVVSVLQRRPFFFLFFRRCSWLKRCWSVM